MALTMQSTLGRTPVGMENAFAVIECRKQTRSGRANLKKGMHTAKKALNYNAREISSQLMRASKARNAAAVLAKAKGRVAMLQRCKGCGQYQDAEVDVAIAHAKRMVKCAQLKVSNLRQEEALKKSAERKLESSRQQRKNEVKRRVVQEETKIRQKAAMEELQQSVKECCRELVQKRRMHRSQERGKIAEADIKYLEDRMNYNHSADSAGISAAGTGVTLEISNAAMSMSELQLLDTEVKMEVELKTAGSC